MRQIPAFSKELCNEPVVRTEEDGCRSGFLDRVHITKAAAREPIENMAAFYPNADSLEYTKAEGNPAHPEFKSGGKMPKFPAPFSKTSIKGGPAHPGTPA